MRRRKERQPYRPDAAGQLARIEAKRKRLKVSREDLAWRAGLPLATLRRMLTSGRGFRRKVHALAYALRTIERERADEDEVLS